MATDFAVLVAGGGRTAAAAAAREAFLLLDQLEHSLSRFIPTSDVARLSGLRPGQPPIHIGLDAFECLLLARQAAVDTGGAFDITLGAGPDAIELLEGCRARVRVEPLRIDLGGIGKGYALDRMAELLADWIDEPALIHGGQSTALALGAPAGGWRLVLRDPFGGADLGVLRLEGGALAGSGRVIHGRHIIDPRSGLPAERQAAWAAAPTAVQADALSTAFMVMTHNEVEDYCARHQDVGGILMLNSDGECCRIKLFGDWSRFDFIPGDHIVEEDA